MSGPPHFLLSLFKHTPDRTIPSVTLTFAQSIDAKLAGTNSTQLILSGPESMKVTHWIRSMHDAILVGINTAINDNPQLNTRLLPQNYPAPIPIILDTRLRFQPSAKLIINYKNGGGKQPWIITRHNTDPDWTDRLNALTEAGARVISLPSDTSDNKISIPALLKYLGSQGIHSLMVEGGARIIESFLATPIDALLIFTTPTLVGPSGVAYNPQRLPSLNHVHTEIIGKDALMAYIAKND